MTDNEKTLEGRTLYIPRMSIESAQMTAAAFQSIGIDARPSPDGDAHTYELARKYTNGDECLPELVTLGNFLKVTEEPDFDPAKAALLMPTSNGPCRFGQYKHLIATIFEETGLQDVYLFSPTSSDGYKSFGQSGTKVVRIVWLAVLIADILRKLLLKTRPYEIDAGATDEAFQWALTYVSDVFKRPLGTIAEKKQNLLAALIDVRERFRSIKIDATQRKPLVGVVGEIFCRLNRFSNNYLLKKVEEFGGEAWISDIAEWVWYTNEEERVKLIRTKRRFSKDMLVNKIRGKIMHADEHAFYHPFQEDFSGYEEPTNTREILKRSRPYLPAEGSLGEMVLNVGKAIWYYEKGAAGIIDISPFTCMNGIICEAIYPKLSCDLSGLPIRTFYFDDTQGDLGRDMEIFMELVKNFHRHRDS